MKITQVEVRDIKRIEYANVTPQESGVTIIGGDNEEGKSSFLDAIAMCLGGKKMCPAKPIREGAETGSVSVKLDGGHPLMPFPCTVSRLFERRPDGSIKSTFEILDEEGLSAPTPQGILNDIMTKAAFDPLEFSRMKPDDQRDRMEEIVGLDFTDIDQKKQSAYNERTDKNREVKGLEATVSGMDYFEDCPGSVVSISKLLTEKEEIESANNANKVQRVKLEHISRITAERLRASQAAERVHHDLERQITQAKQARMDTNVSLTSARKNLAEQEAVIKSLPKDQSTAEVTKGIANAEDTNEQVRSNAERKIRLEQLTTARAESQELTERIETYDTTKSAMAKNAKWPIKGMGFSESGITVDGLPFDQASSAQQLAISTMIGLEGNDILPFLIIKDGSLLGDRKLLEVAIIAQRYKAQVFIERVGEGSECHVIMKDGKVKEVHDKPADNKNPAQPEETSLF